MTGFNPVRVLAQDKQDPTDLFDASMEDLMKVDIDSVYAALGYKQKVTQQSALGGERRRRRTCQIENQLEASHFGANRQRARSWR